MKTYRGLYILLLVAVCMLASCSNKVVEPEYIEINGVHIALDAANVNLNSQGISDISLLYQLSSLQSADIRNNAVPMEQIINFKTDNPHVTLLYSVPINGNYYDSNSAYIDFSYSEKLNIDDLKTNLSYFDNLNHINLTNLQIGADEYLQLKDDFPQIEFTLSVNVCNQWFGEHEESIDLSHLYDVNQDELYEAIAYFDALNTVVLNDALGENTLDKKLIETYPETAFLWNVKLGSMVLPSDIQQIDYREIPVDNFETFADELSHFTKLNYIDMSDCGLENEQMEVLIAAYPNTKFVWKVTIGAWVVSTDAIAFGTCQRKTYHEHSYYLEDDEAANLKYLTDLETLDIGHQWGIEDFSFLEHMPNMKYLILSMTWFEDIGQISHMTDLEFLELFDSQIADFEGINNLTNLKYLNASSILITNVDYLVDMDSLEMLWLCKPKLLSKAELQRAKDSLPDCLVETYGYASGGLWRSYENEGYIQMREALGMEPTINEQD